MATSSVKTSSDRLVTVDLGELTGNITAMAARAADMSDTMAVIADTLASAVSDKFDQQGPGWQGLAESTLRSRRGGSAQILSDSGRLAGSIQPDSDADSAEAATDVEYAVYHVSAAPRSKIPLRDFFDLPDSVYEEAEQTIIEAIIGE
jgi:phage gpG-like protein